VKFSTSNLSQQILKRQEQAKYPDLKGIKVLLVEDSIDNQIMVSRFLALQGAEVDVASNGLEGVKKALSNSYNLLLMDIQMPELDGFGALKELQNKGFQKPAIAITAHGMVEERERCLKMGFSDHLTKPVNRRLLLERVHHFANSENYNESNTF